MNKYEMKILFAASEAIPFIKTGGLADVAGELPRALKKLGCDIRIVLPFYGDIDKNKFNIEPLNIKIVINLGNYIHEEIAVFKTVISDIPVYLIHHNGYFGGRYGLYGINQESYFDNDRRFILFCRSILEMLPYIDFIPDIIHANDWQTGLIPLYLKKIYSYKIRSVFTIHNIAYQGIFPRSTLELAGLGDEYFNINALEFYGNISFLKSGIIYSDIITTVSPNYAEEIKIPEFGYGMDGVIRYRQEHLVGILNGIDYEIWNPAKNKIIKSKYSIRKSEGKKDCKSDLQESLKLPVRNDIPVIAMISRISDQKGFDILINIFDKIMQYDLQFILLGKGEEKYYNILEKYLFLFPLKLSLNLGSFNTQLAYKIYAGADIFLMPSLFEPCGLGQMISMRFGTIPIIRNVGGLHDSVSQFDQEKETGTGLLFNQYSGQELLNSIEKAINIYKNNTKWQKLVYNAMAQDFSWKEPAKKYLNLYKNIIK
ncbi:MAG: glycogen synthase GlgA [Candidatus Firestonebacteria bacterium]|nr:glycogen synthase GlgA [Candidatus Firestonebacteria bacterium]